MASPSLFVGVVSHEGSRFSVSQGPAGLAASLAERLPSVMVQVNTADLLDERQLPLTPSLVNASLTAELRLEVRWAEYLGQARDLRWWIGRALRWGRRAVRVVRPPSVSTIRRLLNIELSHLDLMRAGLASGAGWILVLEDDAMAVDLDDLANGISGLTADASFRGFVNLSRSFHLATLGIEHLLTPAQEATWAGTVPRTILSASRPVTNTVCAMLYSAPFLAQLVTQLEALPMEPVLPIDWKLNLALMELYAAGAVGKDSCRFVEPAPIDQMSMQPTGILPA